MHSDQIVFEAAKAGLRQAVLEFLLLATDDHGDKQSLVNVSASFDPKTGDIDIEYEIGRGGVVVSGGSL